MRNHAGSHETRWVFVVALVVLVFSCFLFTGPPLPANAIEMQKLPVPVPIQRYPIAKVPDLIVSSLSIPSYGVIGGQIKVTDTTRNNWYGSTTQATRTRYWLSADNTVGNDIYVGEREIPPLMAFSESTWVGSFKVPSSMQIAPYYVLVCADNNGIVPEGNERNNCRFSTNKIMFGYQNLMMKSLSNPPATIPTNQPFRVTDTVFNNGQVPIDVETVTKYYMSDDRTVGNDVYLGNRVVPAGLLGGAENTGSSWLVFLWEWAADQRPFYLLACADNTALLREWSEQNWDNCRFSDTRFQMTYQ